MQYTITVYVLSHGIRVACNVNKEIKTVLKNLLQNLQSFTRTNEGTRSVSSNCVL